jgi:outer membrane protein assembly factor BamB
VSGGVVYVGTADRRLVALDAATGAETWSTTLRGRVKSALTVADGRVVVLTEPRHVASFGATGVRDLAARP